MSGPLRAHARRSAERDPDATAVVLADERLSYAELEAESNRLGRLLRQVGQARSSSCSTRT